MLNNEATDAETIPLGATQHKNNFCRQFKSLSQVHNPIFSGRTINISAKTVKTLPHPKANILAIDKSAERRINSTETPKIVNCPLKRSNSRSSGTEEARRTIPAITVAIKPDSLRIAWAKANTHHRPAKTTKFFNSSERKLAFLSIQPINQPPTTPIAAPIPSLI